MKIKPTPLILVVLIVAVILIAPRLNNSFSIIDGDTMSAGLEVWNSNSPETHLLPEPFTSFLVSIDITNKPVYFYEYGARASKSDAVFKFVDASSSSYFTINSAYDSNYWTRFDGVLVEMYLSDGSFFSNYYGGTFSAIRTTSNPISMTHIIQVSYSNNHLIVNVNGQSVVNNYMLKDFSLSSIELSNPSYNGADAYDRYEWDICSATWTLGQHSETETPYPQLMTSPYIDYNIPLLSWNSGQEYYLSDISIYQGWDWLSELPNWTLTMSLNNFVPEGDYGYNYVRVWSSRTEYEFLEIRSDYDGDQLEVSVYDTISRSNIYYFKSLSPKPDTLTLVMSSVGGRTRLLINENEIFDNSDLTAFPLADISWSGEWYVWEGTSSIDIDIVTGVEFAGVGGFPWWIILIIVVAVIVIAYAFGGKK